MMNRFWNNLIRPIIERVNVNYIGEIGSDTGLTEGRTTFKNQINENLSLKEEYNDSKTKIAIKIPAPNWKTIHEWGDYHLALGLKKEFEKNDCDVILQILPEWDNDDDVDCDVVLVLRGLSRYHPKKHHFNIMWNISHPDKVHTEEYNEYDYVLIASEYWADKIKENVNVPVETMLQCTDPELFYPDPCKNQYGLLFVGNSRKVFRKIIKDLLPTDKDLSVYGTNWEGIIPEKYIKGRHIRNSKLRKAYSSCEILLNDHWEDMREKGFISNRLFDGFASGAFILSDNIQRAENVFGDALITYNTPDELNYLVENYLNNKEERTKKAEEGRRIVVNQHTFQNRVKRILEIINQNSPKDSFEMNKSKSIIPMLISKFPSLYIIFNKKNNSIKNTLLNLKGYKTIKKNHLLDDTFYLKNNRDIKLSSMDPIIHYMYYGFKEGRRPNLTFDGDYYLKTYKDVKKSNLNPLIHYSLYGINEKRETSKKFPKKQNVLNVRDKDKTSYISNLFYNAYHKSSDFVEYDANFSVELKQEDIKLIAFYLPQFHPFPENDKWWGKGFTEWTNVTKALPLFVGHYQPHLPIDLGFYDLRLIETQKRQIELAKKYGVFGFCFHYYWFNGKRLMQTPLEIFLNNPKKLDFPFCICWANENWTKRWDGNDDEILIAQKYSSDNDLEFIKDLSEYLRDDRYIKLDNKALIMVYKPQLLPNPKKTFSSWREYCKNEGIGELYIVGAKRHDFTLKPEDYGLDAAVEFPPNHPHPTQRKKNVKYLNLKYEPAVFDLEKFVESKHNMIEDDYKTFKTVIPSWDNTPRRLNEGQVYIGTPKVYKKWLKDAIKFSKENLGETEQFVFINAWNEWAEGAHLEPDRKYGYAYLKATAESIIESRKAYEMEDNIGKLEIKYKVSVIMPTYNREGIIERAINSILNQTFSNLQLIICDDGSSDNTDKLIKEKYEKYLNNGKIIYFKQKNAGVSKARNAALKYADGNLIAYLDSDNYWHSHYLEKMVSAFDENNCNIVYCAMEVHDTSGTIYDKQHFIRNEPYDRDKLVNANFIDLNVFMHKKFLYDELGGFNESLTSMVDWDLILRYTQHNKPFFLNEVLAQYFLDKQLKNITYTTNHNNDYIKLLELHSYEGIMKEKLKKIKLKNEIKEL